MWGGRGISNSHEVSPEKHVFSSIVSESVGRVGIEPTRGFPQGILSLLYNVKGVSTVFTLN